MICERLTLADLCIATGRIIQTMILSTVTTAITLSVLGIPLVLLYLVNNESCVLLLRLDDIGRLLIRACLALTLDYRFWGAHRSTIRLRRKLTKRLGVSSYPAAA